MDQSDLFELLEEKYYQYNTPDFIQDDPIRIPHSFSGKEDIEISAFLVSTLAWGKRKAILKAGNHLMECMDGSPADFIRNALPGDLNVFDSFVYRTFNGIDIQFFIRALRNIYLNHGGLEKVVSSAYLINQSIREALISMRELFFSIDFPERSARHISSVIKGSAAKRLNLFLMWMVRKDHAGVHFGIWKDVPASALMIPLDVHVQRTALALELLERKQADWKAVVQLTERLREFDPADPVKYDFALFGLSNFEKIK